MADSMAAEALCAGNDGASPDEFPDRDLAVQAPDRVFGQAPDTGAFPGNPQGMGEKAPPGSRAKVNGSKGTVCLFADEFTNYNESDIGIKAVMLLENLGYEVIIPRHRESGRTFLSKGLLRSARENSCKKYHHAQGYCLG